MHFIWCVPNRGQNIPTKFVENRSIGKQLEILLRKSRWWRLPYVTWPFRLHVCILYQSRTIFTKFSIEYIVKEMTNIFRNWGWWRPSFWIFATMHFQCNRYVLNRSPNVSTKFGEDRSNSEEMSTVFRNSRWRPPPSWISKYVYFLTTPTYYILNWSCNNPTKFGSNW